MSMEPKDLIARYAQLSSEMIAIASTLDDEALHRIGREGEWSPAFVLHHMADADTHFSARYWHVLTLEGTPLINFDEEIYPDRLQYAHRNPADSLAAIQGIFRMNMNVFELLSESDWQRTGVHPTMGELSLSRILQYAIEHREAHLNQLKELIV